MARFYTNCYDKKNNNKFIGSIVGSCEIKKKGKKQGYIAMLAVENEYRKKGIGKNLVKLLLKIFRENYEVNEVAIETEVDNYVALGLYESFGFIRTKMFINYYLNGNSAYKLKLFEKKFVPVENSNNDDNENK
jgi:peptide alpha-N-acetyltransferase